MEELPKIPTERFRPEVGSLDFFRAEDGAQVNISIPLAPFNSGQPYEDQPLQTSFELVLYLPVEAIEMLAGRTFSAERDNSDSSVYLGTAHNPVDVPKITFTQTQPRRFRITCKLACDFAFEGVGQREIVDLEADVNVTFDGKKGSRFI